MNRDDVVARAKEYVEKGFVSGISGYSCCHFVTTVLSESGWPYGIINWIPTLVEGKNYEKYELAIVSEGEEEPGDLGVLDELFDCVAPSGIGKEDTMCHIVIYIGNGQCIDYGGGKPGEGGHTRQLSIGHWGANIPITFYRPRYSDSTTEPQGNINKIKLFANRKGKTLIYQGAAEAADGIMICVNGRNNALALDCNFGNEFPVIFLNDGRRGIVKNLTVVLDYEEVN